VSVYEDWEVRTKDGRLVGSRPTKDGAKELKRRADHTRPQNGPHKVWSYSRWKGLNKIAAMGEP